MVKTPTVAVAVIAALLATAVAWAQGGGDLYEITQDFFLGRFAASTGEYELSEASGQGDGGIYSGDYYTVEGSFLAPPIEATANVNTAPRAVNDSFSVQAGSTNNVLDVLPNDSDPEGNPIGLSVVTQASKGSIAVTSGGLKVIYTPGPGFAGVDTFTYTITDGVFTSSASVTILVWQYLSFLPEVPWGLGLTW